MEVGYADTNGISGDLGIVPSNWEGDWGRAQHAEIVSGVRVLPDVISTHDRILPERLLQARVKFIAIARCIWSGHARDQVLDDGVIASFAGQHQVFIEWTLQGSCVGNAEHGVAPLDVVSNAQARLDLMSGDQSVVNITTKSEIESPVSLGDLVLDVEGELLHVSMAVEWEQGAAGTRAIV